MTPNAELKELPGFDLVKFAELLNNWKVSVPFETDNFETLNLPQINGQKIIDFIYEWHTFQVTTALSEFAGKLRKEYDRQEQYQGEHGTQHWMDWKGVRNAITDLLQSTPRERGEG